jgi:hypothetical protein
LNSGPLKSIADDPRRAVSKLEGVSTRNEVGGPGSSGNGLKEGEVERGREGWLQADDFRSVNFSEEDSAERQRVMATQIDLYINQCVKSAHSRGKRLLYESK